MINIFIAFALMASAITANKVLLYALTPTALVGIRMFSAGIILFIYTYLHSRHKLKWSEVKKNIFLLLLISISTTLVPSILKAYALQNMPSFKQAFFGTLDPFVTALYAYFLLGEKLNSQKFLGIIIGCIGTSILLLSSSGLEEQLKAVAFISYPELAAIAAVVISRYGWILAQKLLKSNVYSPPQINTLMMLISGIFALSFAFIQQEFTIKSFSHAPSIFFSYVSPEWMLLVFLIYTIIVGNVISYNLYANVLKIYSATFISLSGFSIPLFVSLYGWLFLQEKLTVNFFVACFVTFLGLWVFTRRERTENKS